MGNEPSLPLQENPEGHHVRIHTQNQRRRRSRPPPSSSRPAAYAAHTTQRTSHADAERSNHRRNFRNSIKLGSIEQFNETSEDDAEQETLDPVFSAAATAVSAIRARQARRPTRAHSKRTAHSTQTQQSQHIDNEWKTSLHRLATTAASTAQSLSKVAAPVLSDAGNAIAKSAMEIGDSYVAPGPPSSSVDRQRSHSINASDEETVMLYPQSPARSRISAILEDIQLSFPTVTTSSTTKQFDGVPTDGTLSMPTMTDQPVENSRQKWPANNKSSSSSSSSPGDVKAALHQNITVYSDAGETDDSTPTEPASSKPIIDVQAHSSQFTKDDDDMSQATPTDHAGQDDGDSGGNADNPTKPKNNSAETTGRLTPSPIANRTRRRLKQLDRQPTPPSDIVGRTQRHKSNDAADVGRSDGNKHPSGQNRVMDNGDDSYGDGGAINNTGEADSASLHIKSVRPLNHADTPDMSPIVRHHSSNMSTQGFIDTDFNMVNVSMASTDDTNSSSVTPSRPTLRKQRTKADLDARIPPRTAESETLQLPSRRPIRHRKESTRVSWSDLAVGRLFEAEPEELVNGFDDWQTALEFQMRHSFNALRSLHKNIHDQPIDEGREEALAGDDDDDTNMDTVDKSFIVRSSAMIGNEFLDKSKSLAQSVATKLSQIQESVDKDIYYSIDNIDGMLARSNVFDAETVHSSEVDNSIGTSPEMYDDSAADGTVESVADEYDSMSLSGLSWDLMPEKHRVVGVQSTGQAPERAASDDGAAQPTPSGETFHTSPKDGIGSKLAQSSRAQDKDMPGEGIRSKAANEGNSPKKPEVITVNWDEHKKAVAINVPDAEEMTDAFAGDVLDTSLLALSSLDEIGFLESERPEKDKLRVDLKHLAELRWKQLLANWVHSETWKTISREDRSSMSEPEYNNLERSRDADSSASSISTDRSTINELCAFFDTLSSRTKRTALFRQGRSMKRHFPTNLLSDIGLHVMGAKPDSTDAICHEPAAEKTVGDSDEIKSLQDCAKGHTSDLKLLLEGMAQFASLNQSPETQIEQWTASFSVGIKSYNAIRAKANRKYGGDIRQVKDILRGQIRFPDQASMICALLYLSEQTFAVEKQRVKRKPTVVGKSTSPIQIVRMKNLFTDVLGGEEQISALPTGYRHILLTVRFNDGILAEIQCQLNAMFNVLRGDGYALHQSITRAEVDRVGFSEAQRRGFGIVRANPARLISLFAEQGRLIKTMGNGIQSTGLSNSSNARDTSSPPDNGTKNTQDSDVPSLPPANPFHGNCIEAEAATPASKKACQSDMRDAEQANRETTRNPYAGGGIAAAAAMAAAKKQQKQADDKLSGDVNESKPSPFAGGGIAAAAAMAAAKKQQKQADDKPSGDVNESKPSPFAGGGIAAAAAMAAAKKSKTAGTSCDGATTSPSSSSTLCTVQQITGQSYNESELISSMIDVAISHCKQHSRDVSSFMCLAYLIEHRSRSCQFAHSDVPSSSGDAMLFANCLLQRCLDISNQASSNGMMGWLEYGSSNPLERNPELGLDIAHKIAANFAATRQFGVSFDVLSGLLLQGGRKLPRTHPRIVSVGIDAAICANKMGEHTTARLMMSHASRDVHEYLSTQERKHFEMLRKFVMFCQSASQVCFIEQLSNHVGELKRYAALLEMYLERDFLQVVNAAEPLAHANTALVADCWAVVANCLSAGEQSIVQDFRTGDRAPQGRHRTASQSSTHWTTAYRLYENAFRGCLAHGRGAMSCQAAEIGYNLARCLRELSKPKEAIGLLNMIVSKLEPDASSLTSKNDGRLIRVLPDGRTLSGDDVRVGERREEVIAICLWMMAILVVEESPDERGRVRALSLLHGATKQLESAMNKSAPHSTCMGCYDEATDSVRRLYALIQDEARALYEPLGFMEVVDGGYPNYRLNDELADPTPRDWRDVLTPMRRKRWESKRTAEYTSPRKRQAPIRSKTDRLDREPFTGVQHAIDLGRSRSAPVGRI